jgi:hypothetical protein
VEKLDAPSMKEAECLNGWTWRSSNQGTLVLLRLFGKLTTSLSRNI